MLFRAKEWPTSEELLKRKKGIDLVINKTGKK